MRKSLIAQSIATMVGGLAMVGAANAFVVGPAPVGGAAPAVNTVPAATTLEANPRGVGHMLVVPYFTTQNNNDTYLNIVNQDMRNGKAVKVRFRGASNSDDVLDFTIYLSPGDVWAGAITKPAGEGLPRLFTADKSCTHPAIPATGAQFITQRLHPNLSDTAKASETGEGYIEIFNMADIPPLSAPSLYNDIEHANGVPRAAGASGACTSTRLTALLDAPLTTNYAGAVGFGLEVPTTGLTANWSIVNVAEATSWSGTAWAVEAQAVVAGVSTPGYGNIVFHPQRATLLDPLGSPWTVVRARTADPVLRGGDATNVAAETPNAPSVAAAAYDLPDMSTPYLWDTLATLTNGEATKRQAYRLTQALSSIAISNEYSTLIGLEGSTDWTFTMPTRRYNVSRAYTSGTNESSGSTVFTNLTHNDAGTELAGPVTFDYFTGENVISNSVAGKRHQLCVTGISVSGGVKGGAEGTSGNRTSAVTADREERFMGVTSSEPVFSPGIPGTPAAFCGEASVLVFNAENQVSSLGAEVARRDILTDHPEGWLRMAVPGLSAGAGVPTLGLPTIGASFFKLVNNNATAGVKGTYGLSFPHRTNN